MKFMLMAASLRQDSVNKKLIRLSESMLTDLGETAEVKEFSSYDMPIYDGDIEAKGLPKNTMQFIQDMNEVDGLIFSVPEYNFSMPGSFKNLFDWVSRAKPMPWAGKKVLLLSASPAVVGGNRGLWSIRVPFEACGSFVFPDMFSLASAYDAFNPEGKLVDANLTSRLDDVLKRFVDFTQKL